MSAASNRNWLIFSILLIVASVVVLLIGVFNSQPAVASPPLTPSVNTNREYIVLSWNDLGMHCYNRDFNDLAVLPPANTLWAQVIKVGNPPQVITTGVTVEYSFPTNTYSVDKSNFWSTNPRPGPNNGKQNAQVLFAYLGITQTLPDNIGITGSGLSGQMAVKSDHFVVEYIPITEYNDSDWNTRDPYQLATVIVRDATTHAELARESVVTPVSTEMRCDRCHSDNGEGNEHVATGVVEQNILTKHDQENSDDYPNGHPLLMNSRPVLCAECHQSNAIFAPGKSGIPSLSRAMHRKHAGEVSQNTDGCYNCHPGPATQCLRDVMSQLPLNPKIDCVSCHGTMQQVSQNTTPWLKEPRCDNCHIKVGTGGINVYQQNNALYRNSTGHGGVYCEGCHDSTHAIAPSSQPRDALKFIDLQGHAGTLDVCLVCHSTWPTGAGPHEILVPNQRSFSFTPDRVSAPEPGAQMIYTHTLQNSGTLSDTYAIQSSSSQGWGSVTPQLPIDLLPGQTTLLTVTVNVPSGQGSRGLIDTTIVTATSTISPTLSQHITDVTLIPRAYLYLPLVLKD
jgi:hypothetical protein